MEWSLIMESGCETEGGQVKFYPYKMGGGVMAGKVLAILTGAGQRKWRGSFNTGHLKS